MISNTKRQVSLRVFKIEEKNFLFNFHFHLQQVTNILKNISIVKKNDIDVEKKIDFYTKINKVDKNSQ